MVTQFAFKSTALGATETTETSLGNIQVPDRASVITGVCAIASIDELTLKEGTAGSARLNFTGAGELSGIPVAVTGQGTTSTSFGGFQPVFFPCSIPVTPLSNVACYMTLTKAQTGNCVGNIYLRFE